jgi:hypothetical protein
MCNASKPISAAVRLSIKFMCAVAANQNLGLLLMLFNCSAHVEAGVCTISCRQAQDIRHELTQGLLQHTQNIAVVN